MAAGTVALLYLTILVNGFFMYYPLALIIMLLIGIFKGVTSNKLAIMFHLINVVVLILGCIAMYYIFGTNPFYLLVAGLTVVIYQTAVYHETTLTNYLRQLSLQDWDSLFIHLSPRLAFYVKKYYSRLRELEDYEEEDDVF